MHACAPAMRKRLELSRALKAAPKEAPGGAVSIPSPSPVSPPPSPLDPDWPPAPEGEAGDAAPLRAWRAWRPLRAPEVVNPNCQTESTMPSGMPPPWSDSLHEVYVCVCVLVGWVGG